MKSHTNEPVAFSHAGSRGAKDVVENLVVVLEPDEQSRKELSRRIQQFGLPTRPYADSDTFLRDLRALDRATYFCVVSEIRLPDTTGLQLQDYLNGSQHVASIVFYVSSARVRDVVQAMRQGAIAVVEKSDEPKTLLEYIAEGVAASRSEFLRERIRERSIEQLNQLSVGEQQVLRGIIAGKLNKEMAQELSLSIRTIEQRRREVFRKLGVQHPASLACKVMEVAQARRITDVGREVIRWLDEARQQAGLPPSRKQRLRGPHW